MTTAPSNSLTKSMKKLRCQEILRRGAHTVREDDRLFLLSDVFPLHPEWADKMGVGVERIDVRIGGVYKSPAFWLVRIDGSEVDISYKVSIEGVRVMATFVGAARNEISGQTLAWKRANPAPADGMHCDHVHPFDAILKEWLAIVGLLAEEVSVIKQRVGHSDLFLSRDLAVSWQRHHKAAARYQWLNAEENVAKSNKALTLDWIESYEAEEQRVKAA